MTENEDVGFWDGVGLVVAAMSFFALLAMSDLVDDLIISYLG